MRPDWRQLHESPKTIQFAQTFRGQIGLFVLASSLLLLQGVTFLMPLALAATLLSPDHRRLTVSVAATGMIFATAVEKYGSGMLSMVIGLTTLAGLLLAIVVFSHWHRLPGAMGRHPVIAVHLAAWIGLLLAGTVPALIFVSTAVAPFVWRVSYMAQYLHRSDASGRRIRDHLFYLWPVFGGTSTPYGKGLGLLLRHEATDKESAAKAQLAGIKLLCLALIWAWAGTLMDEFVFRAMQLQGLDGSGFDFRLTIQIANAGSGEGNRVVGWLSLYLKLIRDTLMLAAMGHLIVGCLRLLGYNVFRNTYKPLLAESVLEFWNRYYFYFKELLVEFFFYPAFSMTRNLPANIRLGLAVFAAAAFGNMYYHMLGKPEIIVSGDLPELWTQWGARLIYCLLLATGIWISMLRRRLGSPAVSNSEKLVRLRKIAGVWTFFSVISIFNTDPGKFSIEARLEFLLYLVGLR